MPWRPPDDRCAASNIAAFIEWLHALGLHPKEDPAGLCRWAENEPAAFTGPLLRFIGAREGDSLADLATRWTGTRPAIVEFGPPRRCWTRDALRGPAGTRWRSRMSPVKGAALADLAAAHLLGGEIKPDDRLLWLGSSGDVWPLGALIVGATVVLAAGAPLETAVTIDATATYKAAIRFVDPT